VIGINSIVYSTSPAGVHSCHPILIEVQTIILNFGDETADALLIGNKKLRTDAGVKLPYSPVVFSQQQQVVLSRNQTGEQSGDKDGKDVTHGASNLMRLAGNYFKVLLIGWEIKASGE
jgi:hypothetical protein